MRTVQVRLTKSDAEEVKHKLTVLEETLDLMDDYGVTAGDVRGLIESVVEGVWSVEERFWPMLIDEMQDHVTVLRDVAADARNGGQPGQASSITKQANRLDRTFTE